MPQINFTGDNTPSVLETVQTARGTNGVRMSVLQDIENTLGVVPGFFKILPETHIEREWKLFKDFQLSDTTALSPKMKELVGLAVASVMHCRYTTYFHTVAAATHGATPEEINEALLMAKHTASWSSYLNGVRYDEAQLHREMQQMQAHLSKNQPSKRNQPRI